MIYGSTSYGFMEDLVLTVVIAEVFLVLSFAWNIL